MLTDRFVRIPGHFVCFEYEHVHERGLPVVEVAHDRDIAYHFGEGGQAQEEADKAASIRGGKYELAWTHALSNRVSGMSFSSTVHLRTLMGAMMGSVSGCVSSSCTSVSTSGPYTSEAEG